jgi:integrase
MPSVIASAAWLDQLCSGPKPTERGGPFTADAVNRLIKRIGERTGLPFQVHAHMLRHACGYAMANAGHDTRLIHDWLGHRAIQHTARYTGLSPVAALLALSR